MFTSNVDIIPFIMKIIEISLNMVLLFSLLKKEVKFKNVLMTSIVVFALYQIILKFISEDLKYIVPFVIIIPIISCFYKINPIKVLLANLFTSIIVGLTDVIISIAMFYYLRVDSIEEITNYTMFYYAGFILLYITIILISKIIKFVSYSMYSSEEVKTVDLGIICNYIFTFLLIFPNAFILLAYLENKPLSLNNIIISLISMIAMFILSIFNAQKRYNLLLSEKELEYQKNYNTTLQSLVDSLRTFKHDYNNTLATLYGYVQLNDIKSLKRMFKEILEESRQISSLDKINPNLIKDPNIFGLVTAKYQECVKKNITMNFEIFSELEETEIKIFDLTRVLGIFLDNGIEAASGSKERKLNILISEEKEKIIIEISNTYSDKALSVEKIFEKGMSSKGKNRGLGLYKVKEIIKKYPNVELKTVVDNEMFIQRLTIPKVIKLIEV